MREKIARYRIEKEDRQGHTYGAGQFTNKSEAIDIARKVFRQMSKDWTVRVWDQQIKKILWERTVKASY